MARVYATTADLESYTGEAAPANAAVLLRSASVLVEAATRLDVYAVDVDGYPTGTNTASAFTDATCEQAQFWAANGLDPAAGSLAELGKGHATSKAIKGAQVSNSVTLVEANNRARQDALRTLSESAFLILRNAGLATAAVR